MNILLLQKISTITIANLLQQSKHLLETINLLLKTKIKFLQKLQVITIIFHSFLLKQVDIQLNFSIQLIT